jgi:colanic acid/amylovoran biosynthesis glycosyltransferase
MTKLIFFTFSYPYSNDFSWKNNELAALQNEFDITILPFLKATKYPLTNLPSRIKVTEPVLPELISGNWGDIVYAIFSPRVLFYFKEFFASRVYLNKDWLFKWIISIRRMEYMLNNPSIKEIIRKKPENSDTILYFYWAAGNAMLIPFFKKSGYKKTIVRFHGFDLYEDRNNGYIPFRIPMLRNLDHAVFISQQGLNYAKNRHSKIDFDAHLFKLGCKKGGLSQSSEDGIFRLVSCSNVVDIKRLDLLAEALKLLDFELHWTHLGDGPLFDQLQQNAETLPGNIKTYFAGRLSPEEVFKYYESNPVDLFINVSSTEGIPVSIMEALSAGIPVLATDVGGTGEIIDQDCGKLLSKDIQPDELAKEIEAFAKLPASRIKQLRRNAEIKYDNNCNFDILNGNFIAFLKK